jgi:hypothetical protein
MSLLELGYGPGSLNPISLEIPVYTTNDQMWIESNFNSAITVELNNSGTILHGSTIQPGTVTEFYSFGSSLSTSNLSLGITGPSSFTVPLQFVNPSSGTIGSFVPKYTVRNNALLGSFSPSNLIDKFDIEECLTSNSSASEAQLSLPTTFGSGYVGVNGNPVASTAMIFLQNANPLSAFTFSYELVANYTYQIPNGGGYASSEVEVARSNSVLAFPGEHSIINVSVSNLASLRSGRYTLIAFFQNNQADQVSEAQLLLKSPSVSSWFWLGSCGELTQVGPPIISFGENLTGSISLWPRFLYLMYQEQPGIEGFANISLNLNLNRIIFVVNPNQMTLPSDIQVSLDSSNSDSVISSLDIGTGGLVYLITNGTYPETTRFDLLFGGKAFATDSAVLQSTYTEAFQNVTLGELLVSAVRGGAGIFNATVTIFSNTLNTSITEHTDSNGIIDLFVPPGKYTITVRSGSESLSSTQNILPNGKSTYAAVFPSPVDYTQDLIWIVSFITVVGALGNLWFWFAKRRLRKFLRRQ